ncbi:MAG: hypothetical protein E7Z94_12045 [Actinomyces ruminicola]|nr:hypothetical protein [Actinomyces ruminicola]
MIENVNFVSLWNDFIATVEGISGVDGLFKILAWAGLIILIVAIVSWAIQKRRGGRIFEGRDGMVMVGALIAGLILIAPKVIMPIALFILQVLVNIFIAALNQAGIGS